MVGKTKIGNWSDRLLVWYRLRIPVVHPHPKIPQVSPQLRDKPTPRAIQRDVMDQKKRKKEGKYGASRKRTPANYKCF